MSKAPLITRPPGDSFDDVEAKAGGKVEEEQHREHMKSAVERVICFFAVERLFLAFVWLSQLIIFNIVATDHLLLTLCSLVVNGVLGLFFLMYSEGVLGGLYYIKARLETKE